eukprot:IDg6869t1
MNTVIVLAVRGVSVPVEVVVFLSRRITRGVISQSMNSLRYATFWSRAYGKALLRRQRTGCEQRMLRKGTKSKDRDARAEGAQAVEK